VSLALQILVARLLGIADYGRFAILYGVIVLASGVVTGLVGDALIVLDRADRRIRAGLEVWLAIAAATSAALAAAVAAASGFASPAEAGLFALAMIAFVVEEIVRRLLMAGYAFSRVIAADLTGFVISLALLAAAAACRRCRSEPSSVSSPQGRPSARSSGGVWFPDRSASSSAGGVQTCAPSGVTGPGEGCSRPCGRRC
jgi:hypothetical protein